MAIEELTGPTGSLVQLQRRLDSSRPIARDVEELFAQTAYDLALCDDATTEQLVLTCIHTVELAGLWCARNPANKRPMTVASEVAFTRLKELLPHFDGWNPDVVDRVAAAWRVCSAGPRFLFTIILIRCARPELIQRLRETMQREHARSRTQTGVLPEDTLIMTPGVAALAVNGPRDNALLLARLTAAAGDLDEALRILDDEPIGDPRVLETTAAVLLDASRGVEAMEHLRKALVKSRHSARIRERIIDFHIQNNEIDPVVDQVFVLLEEEGDLVYWHLLTNWIAEHQPERLEQLRRRLRIQLLPKYVEVLMDEGDITGVAEATAAKTFSYEQLWRLGDFLSTHAAEIADKLYERAVVLQGSTAQSKVDCAALGERIEKILPFYERIGKPTKPRRLFRDVLERSRNNIPLKREFERVFGPRPA
jgi:hypothetical protein